MGPRKRRVITEPDESAYEDEQEGESEEITPRQTVSKPSLQGEMYESWTAFETAFAAYSKATFQTFSKRTSTTRSARNKGIKDGYAKRNKETPEYELFLDESFPYYLVSYECTHAGKHRNRGMGKRPRHTVRSIDCKAKLNVLLQREGDRYFMKVSLHHSTHNHRSGRDEYVNLSENRMQLPKADVANVDMLRKVGVSREKILKYIWDHTDCEPNMVDVHNLLAKLKRKEEAGTTLSERVSETLDRFCENDQLAVAHVDIDRQANEYIARCISIQTSHMRAVFDAFPEVLLVDATHDTNASRYKIFSFMVHDAFGRGQHVQHALLTDERSDTLRHALKRFKLVNPSWVEIRCVMVDKDFTEIGVFTSELPEARILLCQFHAIKYIQERVSKTEYGLDAVQRSRLKPVASLIVRAESEQVYDGCIEFMKQVLHVPESEDGVILDAPPFWAYFMQNWHACRSMWCSYLRDNVVHLGNTTNNRLESSWQKIKTVVDRDVELDETITSLIWWAKVKQKEFTTELGRVGYVFDAVNQTTPELSNLAQTVSKHAFGIIKDQYDVAANGTAYYDIRDDGDDIFVLSSDATTCKVDASTWSSYCMLGQTRKLPCRHLMYLRKVQRFKCIIPFGYIADRWLLNSPSMISQFRTKEVDVTGYSEGEFTVINRSRPKSQTDKYKEAMVSAKRFAEILSTYGTPQFSKALSLIDGFVLALETCNMRALERAFHAATEVQNNTPDGAQHVFPQPQHYLQHEPQHEPQQSQHEPQHGPQHEPQHGPQHEPQHESQHEPQHEPQHEQHELNRTDSSSGSGGCVERPNEESDNDEVITIIDDSGSEPEPTVRADPLSASEPITCDSKRGRKRLQMWTISKTVRPPGRPRQTLRQRQFARKQKFDSIKALCQQSKASFADKDNTLAELEIRLNGPVTYHNLSAFANKFTVVSRIPTVEEAPHLCVAVPVANSVSVRRNAELCKVILPREWVMKSIQLMSACRQSYRSQHGGELADSEILLKFQRGRASLFPKITGNYIQSMRVWFSCKQSFAWIEEAMNWIRQIDVNEAQMGSLFGLDEMINAEEVCTCLQHINIMDEEEFAVLNLVYNSELDDVCMTAAIAVICADADSRPKEMKTNVFTTHLMAMLTDSERMNWLMENAVVKEAEDKIVGTVWIDQNHWCGLCISVKTYTYTVMDPRNNKDTITAVDKLFKGSFLPLLKQDKRWRRDVSRYFQQEDGTSCGVLVLAFIESFVFQTYDLPSDSNLLRFRYLLKLLLA